ncbi:chemotaxis protein CheB, partial [Amycolatopsis sp. SID8362]|uniref:chemotaxis protein CheB n=1 Tax=Amycolatopsis sp. SID8362 TaxID=2690346 RepID=UPI00142A2F08
QAGIRAVARCGGTVFAQDEATSVEFGMPGAAILTGMVRTVLPLPELAGAVRAHVAHPTGLSRPTRATRRNGPTRLPWSRR